MTLTLGFGCRENFYLTSIEDIKGFFDLKNYGNGPDPVRKIDQTNDLDQYQLAVACLFIREKLATYLNNGVAVENDWPQRLTSEKLADLGSLTSACLEYLSKKSPNRLLDFNLFSHSICNIFSDCKGVEHAFQIAEINQRLFIVDLSFRQFIDGNLKLKEDEASVIDSLLKNGFIEVKEGVLEIYCRFFESYCRHSERKKTGFNNYREWYLYNKVPSTVNALCEPDHEPNYKDDEIKKILGMK